MLRRTVGEGPIELVFSDMKRMSGWLAEKLLLQSRVGSAGNRLVYRGQVYWCDFGENVGSEQCRQRPALILQNDRSNRSSPNTIVAPITSKDKSGLRTAARLRERPDVNGFVLLGNVRTVSKARLGDRIIEGKISKAEMRAVEEALFSALGVLDQFVRKNDQVQRLVSQVLRARKERDEALGLTAGILRAVDDPACTVADILSLVKARSSELP